MRPAVAAVIALGLALTPFAAPGARAAAPGAPAAAAERPPRLIVAISVDQFSADLFARYRR
jgi:hypothetical protein